MKKFLIILGMLTCLLGMTACTQNQEDAAVANPLQIDDESALAYAQQVIDAINQIVVAGLEDQYASDEVLSAALSSWESAVSDLGEYQGIMEHTMTWDEDSVTIEATVDGTDHDAVVSIVLDSTGNLTSITTNVQRSMSELMTNAALNTLLGMGTVFIVLILISLLIGAFRYIPVIQEKLSGKGKVEKVEKAEKAPAPKPTPVPAPVPAAQPDDGELVAVIAAAIAASENTSPEGFVVRSIRRRGGRWKNA
ncbi:MAG TPA: OadG family protein [Candidatus Eisenbergiella pullicola]|nr:OadG family protein [Candidatus Eisenbergiella pullicola]